MIIHQTITIHHLRIGGISNSSVLQIGTAGLIKPLSSLYNTGGFTGPAPQPGQATGLPLVPFRPLDLR
ncbi:MAG TPA: spore germination protein GerPB [Paenibacillus sp.]|uniref:spore germination protein GerPB n=1 Tax=Paenibacillus sp. TaxID=58172 RepID=UPI0028D743D2|nr:spore germination protein GerPB [Paenibacillus sp.]HUC92752.1 spore germination protein GerPB [Paenibacillus sp.]